MSGAFRLRAPAVLPCDDDVCSVLRDAVVDVDADGRIGYCGAESSAPATTAVVRDIPGILLPGLINTHAHTPMVLLRGLGGDLPLLRWLREAIWPAEARLQGPDIHAGMLLGGLELLRGGVTTSVEMYLHGRELVTATIAAGLRVVLGGPVLDLPGLDWHSMITEIDGWIDEVGLRSERGDLVELGYGAHSAYTLPVEALEIIAGSAAQRGALLQIHVAESADEDREQRARYGSVPLMLESLGALEHRVLAAHAVHLSDKDIGVFATNGVGVAHCPGSNGKLASGIARVVDMRAAGVKVALGTDGPASNDGLDLWQEARLAGMYARLSTWDATALTAADLLLMLTAGGAAAIGREDIGTLSAGRWADMVHINVDTSAFPGGLEVPDEQLLANLVWASGARGVLDVWVAGEQVLRAGVSTRVDTHAALAISRQTTRRLGV